MTPALVSIIVPCRNERGHIESCVHSILNQEAVLPFEVLVVDGMSDDGTREILEGLATVDKRVRIVDNRGLIVSTGLNAAIRAAEGDVILRMDAHTEYALDYVARCLEVLQRTGADNVGGPWRAAGKGWLQRAVALAFQAPFSSGGAGSHVIDYEGAVDSVYLGCWRRETLFRVGLFDEELVRNQDDELNMRIIQSGGSIWQSPTIRSWYFPRASLKALFRQYQQYGYWKVRVIQKHRLPASFRHLVPGGFVATLFIVLAASAVSRWAALLLAALLGFYAAANLVASTLTCRRRENWTLLPAMPAVFAAYHFGYGWGFLRGVLDFMLLRRGGGAAWAALTRK